MPTTRYPRRGSLQFWPRVRAKRAFARLKTKSRGKETKPDSFAGYKVGMTHLLITDNRKTSTTKGQPISVPTTVIECPPLKVAGIRFYKNRKVLTQVNAQKLDKELSRRIILPKKTQKNLNEVEKYDDLSLVVFTQPKLTSIGKKKPELFEITLGGSSKEDKFNFAKENLGKELKVSDFFKEGEQLDFHSVTKGKGFQGVVKRIGVKIRQHKSEKTKRGAVLGGEGYGKVEYTAPQSGKMGYHQRTEKNKWLLKVSDKPTEINPKGGFVNYGLVKNQYILIKGSIPGPKKRLVRFTRALHPNKKIPSEAPTIEYTSLTSKQG